MILTTFGMVFGTYIFVIPNESGNPFLNNKRKVLRRLAARFCTQNKILENMNETRLQILLEWLMILVCVLFEESVFE